MIYFDLDGVLRDLCRTACIEPTEWNCTIGRLGFVDYFNEHKNLLKLAIPTEYMRLVNIYHEELNHITILTDQPTEWRLTALTWIKDHFDTMPEVIFAKDKLKHLTRSDILIDDYPGLKDYSQVWLIDRTYNREIQVPVRIRTPRQLFYKLCEVS